jgi:hypothetical protein
MKAANLSKRIKYWEVQPCGVLGLRKVNSRNLFFKLTFNWYRILSTSFTSKTNFLFQFRTQSAQKLFNEFNKLQKIKSFSRFWLLFLFFQDFRVRFRTIILQFLEFNLILFTRQYVEDKIVFLAGSLTWEILKII